MEQTMMNGLMECWFHGWLMIAGGNLIYGVLALAGAALTKHLFSDGRSNSRTNKHCLISTMNASAAAKRRAAAAPRWRRWPDA
jgi:hypothetical protein